MELKNKQFSHKLRNNQGGDFREKQILTHILFKTQEFQTPKMIHYNTFTQRKNPEKF